MSIKLYEKAQIAKDLSFFKFKLRLAVAAENVNELMSDKLFDVCSCGFEIFSGVELIGMFSEELTDGTGHCKTEVGVDVDLADGESCCFAKLIFGNADSTGHISAVFVDHLNIILRNR